MENINEDEASLNGSSNFQKNLFLVIKKIFPERVNYHIFYIIIINIRFILLIIVPTF